MGVSKKLYDHLFSNESTCISYLIECEVFVAPTVCIVCGGTKFTLHRKNWRCCVKSCRKELSIFAKTFFHSMKLKINDFMNLAYYWLMGVKSSQLINITGHSSQTVARYSHRLRQLVVDSLEFEDIIVGGENIVVEIDESKFGSRKHNRGHGVDGAWVIGGVERTSDRKIFLMEVPDRTASTLTKVIKKYVKPGSIIITDCFRSYSKLNNSFTHYTVNHSIEYVNSDTGAHTNTIEGTWGAIKYKISPRNRVSMLNAKGTESNRGINEFLGDFQWRRKNRKDLWSGLIRSLKNMTYES